MKQLVIQDSFKHLWWIFLLKVVSIFILKLLTISLSKTPILACLNCVRNMTLQVNTTTLKIQMQISPCQQVKMAPFWSSPLST